ncbi:MAG: zf-HC2 domain-containing protein [Corynebacteriales bacterium]|nr:zf-HC2 domain-containing protein [Mycobacteriales bacterium]
MTTPMHYDVGAYALGLLTPQECDEFEAHLAGCDTCAAELEQFMDIALTLPETQVAREVLSAPAPDQPAVAQKATGAARVPAPPAVAPQPAVVQTPRTKGRWAYALAAGVVAIAVAALGGVVLGFQLDEDQSPSAPVESASLLERGERFSATSQSTGVEASLGIEKKGWGTQVAMELSNVRGPLVCQLVAVSDTGETDITMSWTVSPKGWGTEQEPKPLILEGASALPRDSLDRFEVRTDAGDVLVSVGV